MTGPDAFLSHNSHDKPFIEALAQALERQGLHCVLDKWDLHPAANWLRSLEDALRKCKFFVLFIGPNGLGPYHQAELDVALQRQIQERRKLIIPVLLPGITPKVLEGISVFLTSIQALEFRDQDDECALHLLIGLLNEEDPQHLRNLLKQKSAPSSLLRSLDDWFCGITIGWQGSVCQVAIGQGKQCLTIPFKTRQARLDNVASQLEWNYELTGFMGRERELEQLKRWADGEYTVDIQPIVGEGGVGKTRLAFEFAARLRQQGWQAGEAGQTLEGAWYAGRAGILLVIDYPEHRSERVTQLLEALDDLENPTIKLRILLLTRHADFSKRLSQGARALIRPELQLNGFSEAHTQWELLRAAWQSLGEIEQSQSTAAVPVKELSVKELPVAETAFSQWIARDDFHRNPLIILALAVYLFGDSDKKHPNLLDISGREVVRELTLREIKRINKEIPKELQKGTILIKALAAITGGLDLQQCATLLNTLKTQSITPAVPELNQLLEYSIVTNDCIQPLSPDIFAADFLIHALKEYAKLHSAQWQLAVLAFKENRLQNWSLLGRLVFDAQYKLNHRWPMDDLAKAVVHDNELYKWIANEFVYLEPRETRLNPIGIAVLKKIMAEGGIDDMRKAYLNSNLSTLLAEIGNRAGGLEAIQRATQIYEQLAQENFSAYGPYLASSLNNLSVHLGEAGDRAGSLATSRQAVEINERLAKEDFSVYGPNLAGSLDNLSIRLTQSGDLNDAMENSKRAVDIYEQLAKENFIVYGQHLARSLSNYSNRLDQNGYSDESLKTIKKSVQIYEQLIHKNFSAHSFNFAGSLNNLSIRLVHNGDLTGGLDTCKRAVDVYERLTKENFTLYAPYLAKSMNNLSNLLTEKGDFVGGLKISKEAVVLYEQLAKENFRAYGSDLAMSLYNLAIHMKTNEDQSGGLSAIEKATKIYGSLANENFNAFGEDLCLSLYVIFFAFEQDFDYLNQLWDTYQKVNHFTNPNFKVEFPTEVKNMLAKLREQGDDTMVAKLQEIHDALTKPQA